MKENNSNSGIGFVGLLTIVFIVLKLTKDKSKLDKKLVIHN